MKIQDLETYTQIGHSLWADRGRSKRLMIETLSATSLQDLAEERLIERATAALLKQAVRGRLAASPEVNAAVVGNPFFRLDPLERLILTALHVGRWSYARLGRVLEAPTERIEELAWTARVNLATSAIGTGILPGLAYPSGARPATASCPEYQAPRPWTQRFLDDEISNGGERLFFQNHLMACDSCRAALSRCRDLYYAIEKLIPSALAKAAEANPVEAHPSQWIAELRTICQRSSHAKHPVELTFVETLRVFVHRREVQWMLCFLLALIALKISG